MKKGIKRVIIIIIILLALFFCKIFINHQYSLWYIKKFGIEYNTKRKKLGYELLNSDWVRTYSYNRKKNEYYICWGNNLYNCKECKQPAYCSKCQTFYSDGFLNCQFYVEVDTYCNNKNKKINNLCISHLHSFKKGINKYLISYEIKDLNALNALEPEDIYNVRNLNYLKIGKDMIEFPFVENIQISKEKYDSILTCWGLVSPRLNFSK